MNTAPTMTECTGAAVGLSSDDQIRIAIEAMIAHGGSATIGQIRDAVSARMSPATLSKQGRQSLGAFVSANAVRAGLVMSGERGVWAVTPDGREFVATGDTVETVRNAATDTDEPAPSNTVRGAAFERYCAGLLHVVYPAFTWLDQGRYKKHERGLDFIGTEVGATSGAAKRIGVQVKCHADDHTPSEIEWLKFMAGCTLRRIAHGVFITTGRLSGDQRRDASEAGITVIEGKAEVDRVAARHGLESFDADGVES